MGFANAYIVICRIMFRGKRLLCYDKLLININLLFFFFCNIMGRSEQNVSSAIKTRSCGGALRACLLYTEEDLAGLH